MKGWLRRWWWHSLMGVVLVSHAPDLKSWDEGLLLIVAVALLFDAVMARRALAAARAVNTAVGLELRATVERIQELRRLP